MMNDTFRAMRLVAVVTVAVACTTPSLHITVEHPVGVDIARTVVSVYEAEKLECDDVAFMRLGPDELAALLVAEETRDKTNNPSGELAGISRTDHKVIVARGYAPSGEWVTAGCVEEDVVGGTVELVIKTMATVTAATALAIDL